MIVFQWMMFPVLVILSGVLYRRLRQHPLLRIITLMVLAAAMFFLLFPDSSSVVANGLGIGRGVDLIIYLSLLGLTLVSIFLYLKMLNLQKQIEELVRQKALEEATKTSN